MSQLPFLTTGDVLDLQQDPSTVVNDMPVSVWPTSHQRTDDNGEVFDHTGECPLEHAASVEYRNRRLVVDGTTYVIVEAHQQPLLPHVALLLRRVKPGG